MPVTEQLPGRTVIIEGQERLYFSGTSYLGIHKNPEFQQLLMEGIRRYGTHYGSSRASNLQVDVFDKAEKLLADMTGAKAALTLSSGFLAGQAAIRTLDQEQTFLYAPEAHPAVWRHTTDGWHGDYSSWVLALPAAVAAAPTKKLVIVTNSLDPLLAKKYKFDWVDHLPEEKDIILLIDDSHGLGIIGQHGAGIYPAIASRLKPHIKLIVVSSLGKAYGIPGGVVLGDNEFVDQLKKSAFFTAGSPASAAHLYAFLHAQKLYDTSRQQLFNNVVYFQQQIKESNLFHYFDTYPVFYTPENGLATMLETQCLLSSFPYPDPDSHAITRIVISSLHTMEDIDTLSLLINRYAEYTA